jgi:hypothetical protein
VIGTRCHAFSFLSEQVSANSGNNAASVLVVGGKVVWTRRHAEALVQHEEAHGTTGFRDDVAVFAILHVAVGAPVFADAIHDELLASFLVLEHAFIADFLVILWTLVGVVTALTFDVQRSIGATVVADADAFRSQSGRIRGACECATGVGHFVPTVGALEMPFLTSAVIILQTAATYGVVQLVSLGAFDVFLANAAAVVKSCETNGAHGSETQFAIELIVRRTLCGLG